MSTENKLPNWLTPQVWWCKRRDGRIVEHVSTATEGHRGHIRCVAIPELASALEAMST